MEHYPILPVHIVFENVALRALADAGFSCRAVRRCQLPVVEVSVSSEAIFSAVWKLAPQPVDIERSMAVRDAVAKLRRGGEGLARRS